MRNEIAERVFTSLTRLFAVKSAYRKLGKSIADDAPILMFRITTFYL
jgi:hypothetical protein